MSWFYSAGGEQKGPVEVAEFESLIAQGVIRPETLVWQPGMPNWQPASEARPDLLPPAIPGVPAPVPVYTMDPTAGRRYGGFWIRVLARIIDFFILLIPSCIVFVLVVGTGFFAALLEGNISVLTEGGPMLMVASLLNALMYAAYEAFTTSNYGGTLGKMALGLRVIQPDGSNLNLQQALIRHLIYAGGGIIAAIIPFTGVLNGLWVLVDNISVAFDPQKRALHDRIAKTFVVKK
jgi:uncharacterized RDD family membrane protein YckC